MHGEKKALETAVGDAGAEAASRITPMMEQYIEIKTANPDCLLFYRMGDFYELFFEDAEVAARALGIVLTKRGKHLGRDIPMCGVPIERADEYLHRLIARGHRVAVCEQLEDPAEAKRRGAKSVVKRDVVRLVTAGTLTEDALLEARRNNFLLAVARGRPASEGEPAYGLAWLDISTGEFRLTETDGARLATEIARIEPGEIVVAESLYEDPALRAFWRSLPSVTPLDRGVFDGATAERRLSSFFGLATIESFGALSRLELAAAAAAVTYVERTQIGKKPHLSRPAREGANSVLMIDAATRVNLELVRTLAGEKEGSLLAVIDRTRTSAGARLLARRLASPLVDPRAINARLDAVAFLAGDSARREALRRALSEMPDLSRALARLALMRGGPRDLAAIRDSLALAAKFAEIFAKATLPAELADAVAAFASRKTALQADLAAALADELPLSKAAGGFVRAGYARDLDEAHELRDESRRVIAALQTRYVEETGVRALKIKHNNMLGYFVEVAAREGEKFLAPPLRETFIHRQTLAGVMRFSSAELGELESRIASAADRALALELAIFERLAAEVLAETKELEALADAVARIDVAASLADLAAGENWVRPAVDDSLSFAIEGGRHPVVEAALRRDGGPFVANDCDLSAAEKGAGKIWLVTGPNMAGKSTFLRQNALIAILAQIGSFVPAKKAEIGVIDRLFSRVGAADDLARGRSTFMVEMVETAAILNQATARSLVILDEIGRGTATFDGLSIAWACLEHLHEINRSRVLFATHFHELTALAAKLDRLVNATVRVKEWEGNVVFLHEVAPGIADRSYGIQVAKLAGLPEAVIERARAVLAELEASDRKAAMKGFDDLPLFAAPRAAPEKDGLGRALDAVNPDELAPREALEALYRLKALRAGKKKN
ncbi:MAG TPA: DNA mismatch repair protein MutS [Xanthobacteraceae bacterium]|nr:DNA mismatch repair protein MutS [Xanthobacteraceae bacterium]